LIAIPGIGPVTATAVIAAIGNGAAFRKGREFSAWVGMIPREASTGGKQKLLGICKRGNPYLRKLFVQGARAVMLRRTKQSSGLSTWLKKLTLHKPQCRCSGFGQESGPDRLGSTCQGRRLSALSPGRRSLNLRGL
jgi:transposase